MNDFRYALRSLRHNPGFALTAIVSIALGIGANSTVFSLADGLLLRPLPVPHASQVVTLYSRTPSGRHGSLSYADFRDIEDRNRSFDGLAAYQLMPFGFAAAPEEQPTMKAGLLVNGRFFSALHIAPALGRVFRPDEDRPGAPQPVLMLGHDLWKSNFASDPAVIGKQVLVNGIDLTVIGRHPESFTGLDQYFHPLLFMPAALAPKLLSSNTDQLTNRASRGFSVKARLKPGVSLPAADADVASLAHTLSGAFPNTNLGFGAAVRTELEARNEVSPGDATIVALLFCVVTVVLLIACANVANLVLSRGRGRSREIAIRLAVGASRLRLARELLAESFLIAVAGGAVGLLIAEFGIYVCSSVQIPSDIPIEFTFNLDSRALVFTMLAAVLCALLFGFVPAFAASKTDLLSALKVGFVAGGQESLMGS